ncbi:hypothetical protein K488DRAFT_89095 [Vararia minispora EC-137]|uniref:Uncharacterized protein n=1 Tax=Vararia minispora EC-137 TaxID=1314806 RepID=A0ACB8QCR5_9AGAM|nr:hypothetical protein K488DRAFT_89095 [Vararia minispora EC-137]
MPRVTAAALPTMDSPARNTRAQTAQAARASTGLTTTRKRGHGEIDSSPLTTPGRALRRKNLPSPSILESPTPAVKKGKKTSITRRLPDKVATEKHAIDGVIATQAGQPPRKKARVAKPARELLAGGDALILSKIAVEPDDTSHSEATQSIVAKRRKAEETSADEGPSPKRAKPNVDESVRCSATAENCTRSHSSSNAVASSSRLNTSAEGPIPPTPPARAPDAMQDELEVYGLLCSSASSDPEFKEPSTVETSCSVPAPLSSLTGTPTPTPSSTSLPTPAPPLVDPEMLDCIRECETRNVKAYCGMWSKPAPRDRDPEKIAVELAANGIKVRDYACQAPYVLPPQPPLVPPAPTLVSVPPEHNQGKYKWRVVSRQALCHTLLSYGSRVSETDIEQGKDVMSEFDEGSIAWEAKNRNVDSAGLPRIYFAREMSPEQTRTAFPGCALLQGIGVVFRSSPKGMEADFITNISGKFFMHRLESFEDFHSFHAINAARQLGIETGYDPKTMHEVAHDGFRKLLELQIEREARGVSIPEISDDDESDYDSDDSAPASRPSERSSSLSQIAPDEEQRKLYTNIEAALRKGELSAEELAASSLTADELRGVEGLREIRHELDLYYVRLGRFEEKRAVQRSRMSPDQVVDDIAQRVVRAAIQDLGKSLKAAFVLQNQEAVAKLFARVPPDV